MTDKTERDALVALATRMTAWVDEPFVNLTPMRKADVVDLLRNGPGTFTPQPAEGDGAVADAWQLVHVLTGVMRVRPLTPSEQNELHSAHVTIRNTRPASTAQVPDDGLEFFAVPDGLNPQTVNLIARFATALAEKLAAAERKYGYSDGWADPAWMDECRDKLVEHVAKGDPRDVAAYCAFLWHHGERTAAAPAAPKGGVVDEAMVERALAAYLRVQDAGESLYGCVTSALTAALATGEQP